MSGIAPTTIPVIDLFAGPGGLSEGFVGAVSARSRFEVVLSIEMDQHACRTLLIRKVQRGLRQERQLRLLRNLLSADAPDALIRSRLGEAWDAAANATWQTELGVESTSVVDRRIKDALGGASEWVLIGGPPCQAYSLVGRARMRPADPAKFDRDHRHFLYKEYLRVIRKHRPTAFVMENVKGLLSSRVKGSLIVDQILSDLKALGYALYGLAGATEWDGGEGEAGDFVLRAEDYGVPQARHRVIICGIREDRVHERPGRLRKRPKRTVRETIGDLPRLRSRISRGRDSLDVWRRVLSRIEVKRAFRGAHARVTDAALKAIAGIDGAAIWHDRTRDESVLNHASRSHMESDLHRYLFAACFAAARGRSPGLGDFPSQLLPKHKNISSALSGGLFADRFRVQVADRVSSTVVAHIAKDGHYFIHYDPSQCRSLTVREAARLQTFPDDYWFSGPQTEQFRQVGNAVPPLLAKQVAATLLRAVWDFRKPGGS